MKIERQHTSQHKSSKLFVGCLPSQTSSQELKNYFSKFVMVESVKVKYRKNGICCGYGYLFVQAFKPEISFLCSEQFHFGGRKVEIRPFFAKNKYLSIHKGEQDKKLFVANLPPSITGPVLSELFSHFGKVQNAYLGNSDMFNKSCKSEDGDSEPQDPHQSIFQQNRILSTKFGFVIFQNEQSLLQALGSKLSFQGHNLMISRPRDKSE